MQILDHPVQNADITEENLCLYRWTSREALLS